MKEDLITKVNNWRVELIEIEETDLFANYQAPVVLEPRIWIYINVLHNYTYNIDKSEILLWS